MSNSRVERVSESNIEDLFHLIEALARFERLDPPDQEAKAKLRKHAMDDPPLFSAFLAYFDGRPVGYITYYFTYSTFLARPTLFLEDIFVLEGLRKQGIGAELFRFCAKEALERGCGRMEWSVLTWNENAIRFYESMGGKRMGWYFYRLDEEGMRELDRGRPK
jgi:GNAT superfamily N-acetyltransferase